MSILPTGGGLGDYLPKTGTGGLTDTYDLSKIVARLASAPAKAAKKKKDQEGYRPKQWGTAQTAEQLIYVKSNIGGLFFDALLNTDIENDLTITSHPVQSGANFSDHAFMNPVKISMQIAMSDAMASMLPGQWTGAYTKSVSAYRMLCDLQAARIPLRVLTRLNEYNNMLITNISVSENSTNLYGLRANVQMQQILVVNISTEKVSARKWNTDGGAKHGEVQPVEEQPSILGGMDPRGTTTRQKEKGGKAP